MFHSKFQVEDTESRNRPSQQVATHNLEPYDGMQSALCSISISVVSTVKWSEFAGIAHYADSVERNALLR
jgi:hypothetical protein